MRRLRKNTGTVLADFVISVPLLLIAFLGAGGSAAYLYARAALTFEAYWIARAHLYGNDRDHCKASSLLWTHALLPRIRYVCSGVARVDAHFDLGPRFSLNAQVDLRP